ncbi:MAG: RES family NAD+ phosphorylase [Desulfobulbus sp.]|nr:RES family NAD+ phosphorylase [Desulfobulbus sp.]
MKLSFPDIEFLQEKTRAISCETEQPSIIQKLNDILSFYKILNFDFGYNWPLWRARKCSSFRGYNNLRDLSHPPAEKTRLNRLNNDFCPLLYTSINKFTAFTEVAASEGDYLHTIGYAIRPNTKLRCAIVGEVFNTHRSGNAKTSGKLTTELNRILNSSDYRAARSWVFLDAFLAELLSDKNANAKGYLHTRAIADYIFNKVSDIDAIYYPSVVLENGVNIAIKPDAATRLLDGNRDICYWN